MADYLHGAYGEVQTDSGSRAAAQAPARKAFVYVGTAPVHTLAGGAQRVNKPILIEDIAQAREKLGYIEDFASYTLCEAMKNHLIRNGVGPLVMINALDPATHFKTSAMSESKTPSEGAFTLSDADLIVLDSITVDTKTLDTDYTASVNSDNNTVVIAEKTSGALGTAALTVTYDKKTVVTVSKTPSGNTITIANAADIILDSIVVQTKDVTPAVKVAGTDYTASYSAAKNAVIITGITDLGSNALDVIYSQIDPSKVTAADVIGETNGMGINSGLYAIANVYQETGYIPSFLLAPGFSSMPTVHAAMLEVARKINGHFDAYVLADIPINDGGTPVTLANAPTWKTANGYNNIGETVYFPMVKGTDGLKYHLSSLAAANLQTLLHGNGGRPYESASNTDCPIIQNLYFGEGAAEGVYDDTLINRTLNRHGIASAAFTGGRWAIWGAHTADYDADSKETQNNISETNVMMLYDISNDFQHRRPPQVDEPITPGDLKTMLAEEQEILDRLVSLGALLYGTVYLDATSIAASDVFRGDYVFSFEITVTPLARSLKAHVAQTSEGYVTYLEAFDMSE